MKKNDLRPRWIAVGASVLAASAVAVSNVAHAGVVGNGTAESCTNLALQQQINAAGKVTFNCGGPITIPITATLVVDATKSVTIDGAGQVTLDGGNATQIMTIPGGPGPFGQLTVNNMTFTRGLGPGGALQAGGAILNQGVLVVNASTFIGNKAARGGAIFSSRCITAEGPACAEAILGVENSVFVDNTGFNSGGAISVNGDRTLIQRTTFQNNRAGFGGGLHLDRFSNFKITATLDGNTFDGNEATNTFGGGINIGNLGSGGKAVITNSTFSGNKATGAGANAVGGAIMVSSAATLDHLTIANNSATTAGGGVQFAASANDVRLQEVILSNNTGGNCGFQGGGGFAEGLKNLQFGDATCTGAVVADPKLAPLADNGGATKTMALLEGSPAIDGSDPTVCLTADQRGIPRVHGTTCDLGAFEFRGPLPAGSLQALWWARPPGSEAGWGVNFAHQDNIIFVTWFTYGLDGKPTWFIALLFQKPGTNVFSGEVSTVTGNPFNSDPFDPATVVETPVGTMTIVFSDNDTAVFSFVVSGVRQTKTIGRQLYAEPVPSCQWPTPVALETAVNFQDLWWAKPPGSQAGWGINFSNQGNVIFITWFTYGPDGKPLWFIVLADKSAPNVYSGPVSTVVGSPFSSIPFDSSVVQETVVGNATITFGDGNNAVFDYTINGIHQTKQITRQVFAEPGTICQ
jgi:predicted outer membrane repeat protein